MAVGYTRRTRPSGREKGSSMSSSVNRVILLGRLGQDPEVRFTPGGQAVCNFSLATDEEWKGKDGEKQKRTEWCRIVVWGKLAELCGEYLKKGRQAYVEGRLQTREYEKDGQRRFSTEIIASTVVFLGGKDGGRSAPQEGRSEPPPTGAGDDDIPF